MHKTPTQEKIEAQRQGNIRSIVVDVLERYREQKNLVVKVADDLDISVPTLHTWCREFSIDIDDYRRPVKNDA